MSPNCSRPRALRWPHRIPTLVAYRGCCWLGRLVAGHDRRALTFGEKSAKNRLEYRSEPTSLRLRNRPEIVPRRLRCSEHRFLEAWPRRPVETKAGTAKPDRTANGIAKISDRELSRFGAHLRDVALC